MTHNPIALITGASSGIGKEFASILAREGYDLVLVARSKDSLEKIAANLEKKYKISAEVYPLDLTQDKAIEWLAKKTDLGAISVLINNAGFGDYGEFEHSDLKKQKDMIDLNVRSLTELTHYVLPGMTTRSHGSILNVASIAGFMPGPLMSVYYATKAYVLSFSSALAEELADTNITVTALCPGPTKSKFSKNAEINGGSTFSGNLPTAQEVAEFGYNQMVKGKRIAVHGLRNKIVASLTNLAPRSVQAALVKKVQSK